MSARKVKYAALILVHVFFFGFGWWLADAIRETHREYRECRNLCPVAKNGTPLREIQLSGKGCLCKYVSSETVPWP